MAKVWFALSLLLVGVPSIVTSQQQLWVPRSVTPRHLTCDTSLPESPPRTTCSHMQLPDVPQGLPDSLELFDLSFNAISRITNASFQGYPNLRQLNLKHNLLSFLETAAFHPLEKLEVLNLDNNQLLELPQYLFPNHAPLTTLLAAYNKLTKIPTGALTNVKNLKTIGLRGNLISFLDFTAFSAWTNMRRIDLAENNITSLHQRMFRPFQNCTVREFNLTSNGISNLPSKVFSYFRRILYLDANKLHLESLSMQSLTGNMSIKRVSLIRCGIRMLSPISRIDHLHEGTPDIQEMILQANLISSIPDYTFRGLSRLTKLDLSSNRINSLSNFSFEGLPLLIQLNLGENILTAIPFVMFQCVNKLQSLLLASNSIQTLNTLWFQSNVELIKLDLNGNKIEDIQENLWNSTSLQTLDLSNNRLESLHNTTFSGLGKLKVLNVSFNSISSIEQATFQVFHNIENIKLREQRKLIVNGYFNQMKKLAVLDLSGNLKITFPSVKQFVNTSSLTSLNLSYGKQLRVKDLVDYQNKLSLFTGLISLQHLFLQYNNLFNINTAPWVFSPLVSLETLDLQHNFITTLQSQIFSNLTSLRWINLDVNWIVGIAENALGYLPSLQVLILKYNNIEDIERKLFAGTPNLTKLYLQGNRIATILPGTILPPHLAHLDISSNALTCDCSLAGFISWLRQSSVNLDQSNDTRCSGTSFTKLRNKHIMAFHPEEFCGINKLLVIGVSATAVTVLFLGAITYRKRWWLHHKFFLLKLCVLGYEEITENRSPADYEYQLNVMSHESDDRWVQEHLRPAIAERMPHLRNIIYGDDDLPLEMYYLNAMHHAIDNSFKTMLILNNQSVHDPWLMTKLRMALEHVNDTGLDKVVLVFREDIEDGNLPYLVRPFMGRNRPYLLWTEDDEDGQEWFWAKLKKCMRANKTLNSVIPL